MQLHHLLFFLFLSAFHTNSLAQGTISLTVQNITTPKGTIMVALYNSESTFLSEDETAAGQTKQVQQTGAVTVQFKDLPYGTYTIAIFHDINDNGALDTNLFGVPKEPYGFSNNARSKWGAPKYEMARFELQQRELTMQASVKKWSEQ